ncbi:MAG: TRL-like family protein [Rickettsiales bacterium]|nr:TRL-like family protein [Rickettsiales bacterium]
MKKLLTLSVATLLAGCAYTSQPLSSGALATSVSVPLIATSEASTKTGTACAKNILGLVTSGDASIEAAKKEGGITRVSSVSLENSGFLGLYAQSCTVVSGN